MLAKWAGSMSSESFPLGKSIFLAQPLPIISHFRKDLMWQRRMHRFSRPQEMAAEYVAFVIKYIFHRT